MRLSDFLSEQMVLTNLQGTDSSSVLSEFSTAAETAGTYRHPEILLDKLLDREKQGSTGIGKGIAIPHCKIDNLDRMFLGVAYSDAGVDFNAIDGQPVYFFFFVVSPGQASVLHLRVLAALSRLLKSQNFMDTLRQKPQPTELIDLIRQEEVNL